MLWQLDARRVVLTILFALWLSAQSCVIALSPAWGFVLPHEHITRGVLSERAWQEHLREHELAALRYLDKACEGTRPASANAVLASIPESASALSLFVSATAIVQDTHFELAASTLSGVTLTPQAYFAFDLFYSPPEPPPNL